MKQKILVTGAAGFIGSHLVDLLIKEEPINKLRLFVKKNESLKNLPTKKFDIVFGDIRDKKAVAKAMENVDTVYHLAAKIDFDGKRYEEYKEINVDGTQNLLNCCKGRKIQKFVFFSSIAVFGVPADVGNIENWNENHSKNYSNFYGQSKLEAEEKVIEASQKWNIPYAIIRPASVYGPREKGPTLAMYKAIKNHHFFIIGRGKNKLHYVYVIDLVRGARQAQLSKKRFGDYILAGPEPNNLDELAQFISQSINCHIPSIRIPKLPVLVVSYPLEIIGKAIGIKFPIFPSRIKTMTTTYFYNIAKAKNEFGYKPKISLKKGTKITGDWYVKNNYL